MTKIAQEDSYRRRGSFVAKTGSGDGPKDQTINFQIIHFTKFCQLNDQLSCLSSEVLNFYINIVNQLKDDKQAKVGFE